MKFPMIHTDAQGETHFGVRDIPDREVPFGPPPNPTGQMTDFGAVTSMFVFSVPAGTNVPAPRQKARANLMLEASNRIAGLLAPIRSQKSSLF